MFMCISHCQIAQHVPRTQIGPATVVAFHFGKHVVHDRNHFLVAQWFFLAMGIPALLPLAGNGQVYCSAFLFNIRFGHIMNIRTHTHTHTQPHTR